MEYKIIFGNPAECQRKLNQWKHEYTLNVIAMESYYSGSNHETRDVTILLTRSKKRSLEGKNGIGPRLTK